MERPSSQYLTHQFPAWSGCTVNEILIIWGICLITVFAFLFSLGILIGYKMPCIILVLPVSWAVVKTVIKKIEATKQVKPYGYAVIKLRLWLEEHMGVKSPYLTHKSSWSTKC